MEKKNIFLRRRRKSEKEKEENIWRRKISFCGGEERERRYFEQENFFLVEGKKNGRGKGGKYNREENIVAGGQTGGREWKARKRSWQTLNNI